MIEMIEGLPTASPLTVAAACALASANPPKEEILAGALFAEADRTIRALYEGPRPAMSEGAFRMGARAMCEVIKERGERLIAERIAARSRRGNDYIAATLNFVCEAPLPAFPRLPKIETEPAYEWWAGHSEEWYHLGPYATRDDALAAARRDYGDGVILHLIEAVPQRVTFSADSVIEAQYFEDDDYFSGENGEPDRVGGDDVVAAADAELQAILDVWAERWQHTFVRPELFGATRNYETIALEAAA